MEVVTLIRQDNTARLHFQRDDKPVNVLDETCITQLEAHLDTLEKEPPRRLVVESGVQGCFIAGADIEAIAAVQDAAEATRLAERGQALCRRIESLPAVSIAVVHGACMGGGMELALACDHILAVEDKRTKLALPEIQLGIHPGFGGCVRLPKRVGWIRAVEMILSGRPVDARRARRIGLAALNSAPEQIELGIEYLAGKGKAMRGRGKTWWLALPLAKALFFRQVEKKALARFRHLDIEAAYPAIPATITLLREMISLSDGIAYAREAASLGRLAVTPTCKNLIRVFHLGNALKKQEAVRRGKEAVLHFRNTSVYGAGVMGSGIAWVAARTTDVDMHDVAAESLAHGMKSLGGLARRDTRRLQRIRPVLDHSGLAQSDVVIEAVLEDIDIKRALWKDVEAHVSEKCLLLSNTSSLSITDMQQQAVHPERIAGLHFFNPAPKMPLVEVVAGKKTAADVVDQTAALAAAWGKYPLVVVDRPGFLVNRCLMPFMVAALQLIEQGQKAEHVDGALKHFGMPMGAIELADRVGLDICLHVGTHLADAFGARFSMPDWLSKMVNDGELGAKSGSGFFVYSDGKQQQLNPKLGNYLKLSVTKTESHADISTRHDGAWLDADIVDYCLLPMLVEALACLHEGIVQDARHLAAAFIYGVGFPPFRGGLLREFALRPRDALQQKIEQLGLIRPDNLEVLDDFA